jgi:predicted regulator of Ras-like GTPase activity (Roadblock/LC7/MglB family)
VQTGHLETSCGDDLVVAPHWHHEAGGEGGGTMAQLRELLRELTTVQGIKSAVVVGRDGFVIDGVTEGTGLDADAVGAVISTGIGSSEVMGRELDVGAMTQGMVEYEGGLIVMALLGADAILAVVADLNANLGNVRFQIKKRLQQVEQAL